MDQVYQCLWWFYAPTNLLTQPVERDWLVFTILTSEFQEHGASKWKLLVNRSTAENVSRSKRKWNMLDHVGKEFEIFQTAHEI